MFPLIPKPRIGSNIPLSGEDAAEETPDMDQHKPPKLLDRLRETLRRRHYSIHTEDAYAGWCRRFILFHNQRHP